MTMMRQFVSAAFGLCLCASGAWADSQQGVVVELYTSQGCSSCPPADDLMAQLVQQPGVIGLTLHVDYWDYIGWADTFGQAAFSERQKAYATAAGEKMIYTPQMIVGGLARVEGNNSEQVAQAIAKAAELPPQVKLLLARQGDKIAIHAESAQPLAAAVRIELVQISDQAEVAVERGENAGLSLQSHNTVTSWQSLGDWNGLAALDMLADAGAGPVVVILQRDTGLGPAEILAAALLKQ
jgi:hypothetical protein